MDIEILCNTPDETLFRNVEINSKRSLEWVKEVEAHDGHAVIVGGGPSVADCIELIRWRQSLGQKVFALNGAAKFLYDHGIKADYQVVVDGRPHNSRFIGWSAHYLLASQCDPECFETVHPDFLTLWHPVMDMPEDHIQDDREYALIGGGTTVGLSSMCLAYALGYRKIHLYGYDSSHRGEAGHAYQQPENSREPIVKVKAYGKEFDCSLAMAYQAELFPECANNLIELGCVITMDGDGLLPTAFRHLWSEPANMSEQAKYQSMWDFPEYRTVAPGELVADAYVAMADIKPSDVVVDFGCGTGRGAKRIHELTGCEFILIDFTDNSLDAEISQESWYTLIRHDLTLPLPMGRHGHGFCTDVMEHIPPDQVDDVIRNVMNAADLVFFQISLVDDACGALIGHPLHLSVHPMDWWAEKFKSLCYTVKWSQDEGNAALFYVAQ